MKDSNNSFDIAQQHSHLWTRHSQQQQQQHQPVIYPDQAGDQTQVPHHERSNMLVQQHMSMPQGHISQYRMTDQEPHVGPHGEFYHQRAHQYQQVQSATINQEHQSISSQNFPPTAPHNMNANFATQQYLRLNHEAEVSDDRVSDWTITAEPNSTWQDGHDAIANRPTNAYMNHHYQYQQAPPSQSIEQHYIPSGTTMRHYLDANPDSQPNPYMIEQLYNPQYMAAASGYSYSNDYGQEGQQLQQHHQHQQDLAPQQQQQQVMMQQQQPERSSSQLDGFCQQLSMLHQPQLLISQEWLDTICRQMIEHMNSFGICVIDNFLGSIKGEIILKEVKQLFSNKSYTTGRLVSDKVGTKTPDNNTEPNNARAGVDEDGSQTARSSQTVDPTKTIRNDRVIWVDGCEEGCEEINNLIQTLCQVITNSSHLSLYSNNGLDKVVINKRTKAHVACYPGHGTKYIKHVDNPNGDGRVITAIYYLNKDWNTKRDGGLLRMFPTGVDTVANIEPLFDRVLFFWSDRRNPHEVLPAYRDRFAITVWYIGESRAQET